MNNFNFTKAEFKALKKYEDEYRIFVNSNASVKLDGNIPAIITINPKLDKFVKPTGKLKIIKAARVKYVSGATQIVKKAFDKSIKWCHEKKIPALITYMRFSKKIDLHKYTDDASNYAWTGGYFRQKKLKTWKDKGIHYCDLLKEGCPSCMNCAKLTFGMNKAELYGVNLSASGMCKMGCPNCFAQRMIPVFGITFDNPTKNRKQKGMKHK